VQEDGCCGGVIKALDVSCSAEKVNVGVGDGRGKRRLWLGRKHENKKKTVVSVVLSQDYLV
jgi:hypothetical protein